MDLSTLGGLKSAIASFLNRGDLTAVIPEFVDLAFSDISLSGRHWRMYERSVFTLEPGERSLPLPSGWRGTSTIQLNTDPVTPLRSIPPDQYAALRAQSSAAGRPTAYLLLGEEILLHPTADQEYTVEMVFTKAVTTPDTDAGTNWVLSHYPQLALYGAMHHAYDFLMDEAKSAAYWQKFQAGLQALRKDSESAQVVPGQATVPVVF